MGHAREMGCLRLRSKRRVGPSDLDFVMPKVKEVSRGDVKGSGGEGRGGHVPRCLMYMLYLPT